jgi:hypothetical protein
MPLPVETDGRCHGGFGSFAREEKRECGEHNHNADYRSATVLKFLPNHFQYAILPLGETTAGEIKRRLNQPVKSFFQITILSGGQTK